MYLSDRDLAIALATGQLIVNPLPTEMDTTGIDLHLDKIEEARVWNLPLYEQMQKDAGHDPVTLGVGKFNEEESSEGRGRGPASGDWCDGLTCR